MKIEEMYPSKDTNCMSEPTRRTEPEQSPKYDATNNKRLHRKSVTSAGANVAKSAREKARQQSLIGMKFEQLSRHEEYSYLLEAETNQAILDNIVSKEELCRFLSPLKFYEIETWRNKVPYGLGRDGGIQKRKWKTPLELLYGGIDPSLNQPSSARTESSEKSSARLDERQAFLSLNNRRVTASRKHSPKLDRNDGIFRPPPAGNAAGEDDITIKPRPNENTKKETGSTKTRREVSSRRPATSPERQRILDRIKREKILTGRYSSATRVEKQGSKVYGSYEALSKSGILDNRSAFWQKTIATPRATGRLYDRQPKSARKMSYQTSDLWQITNLHHKDFNQSDGRTPIFSARETNDTDTTPTSARRGTRAAAAEEEKEGHLPSTVDGDKVLPRAYDVYVPLQSPEKISTDISRLYRLDPNIAFFPSTQRKGVITNSNPQDTDNSTRGVGNQGNKQQQQQPAQRENTISPEATRPNAFKTNIASTRKPIKLTRDPLVSKNQTSPRIVDVSSGFKNNQDLNIRKSWSSKLANSSYFSPWASQTISDFSKSEVIAKAERDGYYVRKSGKSVSFDIGGSLIGVTTLKQSQGNASLQQRNKNISMFVVNVGQARQSTYTTLSPRGVDVGVSRKKARFPSGNVVPVRP